MKTVVIGAGLAGLVAAIRLARGGAEVVVVTKGIGGLPLSQGTIDVWGYRDSGRENSSGRMGENSGRIDESERVTDPFDAVASASATHPYAAIGVEAVRTGLAFLRDELNDALGEGAFVGGDANVWLPTAVGAVRPTYLVPEGMAAGACVDGARFAIVGLRRLKDFSPALIAGNLARTVLPGGGRVQARALTVDLPARADETDSSGLTYARAFDEPGFALRLAAAIKPLVDEDETVGLPAILGLRDQHARNDLIGHLGRPVFEIPLPPPSVPGLRLNDTLTAVAKSAGVRVVLGSPVTGCRAGNGRIEAVTVATAGHSTDYAADTFLLAAGGFESGALALDSYGQVAETVLGLPVVVPEGLGDGLVGPDYWAPQPLFSAGLDVDTSMHVLRKGKTPVFPNLYAAGGILAGAQRWREKSGDGIAVGSAVKAADAMMGDVR